MLNDKVSNSLNSLLGWFEANGNAGYDPYDIKGLNMKMLNRMQDVSKLGLSDKIYRYLVIELADIYFPKITRKYYGVKPKVHATAQGLLFETYLNLYSISNDSAYLAKAEHYRNWLLENRSKFYPEHGWGTPFEWRAGDVTYKTGEPFAVVNAWVGSAFFKSHKITGNQDDLEVCNSICEFFINRLHISNVSDGKICFSYSAVKPNFINNSNLFVAEFLIRIGKETQNQRYIDLGKKAANYSVGTQLDSGVLPYFGPEEKKALKYDSYHSGYEIRMLYSIYEHIGDTIFLDAAKKYLDFFIKHFLDGDRIQTKANKKYPVDITSAAETILLLNHVREILPMDETQHKGIVSWIIDNLQTKKGWFIYRIQRPGVKIKIPYIRWGEAWMALALSDTLLNTPFRKSNQTKPNNL